MIEPVKLCSSEPRELAALIAERHELLRLLTQVKIGVIVLTTMMAGFILLLSWNFAAGSIEFWPFVLLTACVFSACMVYIRQIRLLGLYPQRGVDRRGTFPIIAFSGQPIEGMKLPDTAPRKLRQRLAACEAQIERLLRSGNDAAARSE